MKCLSADGPFLIVADQACEWQSLVQAKCRALTTDTLCFSFLTDLRRLHSSQSIHADYIFKYRFLCKTTGVSGGGIGVHTSQRERCHSWAILCHVANNNCHSALDQQAAVSSSTGSQ